MALCCWSASALASALIPSGFPMPMHECVILWEFVCICGSCVLVKQQCVWRSSHVITQGRDGMHWELECAWKQAKQTMWHANINVACLQTT